MTLILWLLCFSSSIEPLIFALFQWGWSRQTLCPSAHLCHNVEPLVVHQSTSLPPDGFYCHWFLFVLHFGHWDIGSLPVWTESVWYLWIHVVMWTSSWAAGVDVWHAGHPSVWWMWCYRSTKDLHRPIQAAPFQAGISRLWMGLWCIHVPPGRLLSANRKEGTSERRAAGWPASARCCCCRCRRRCWLPHCIGCWGFVWLHWVRLHHPQAGLCITAAAAAVRVQRGLVYVK